MKRFILTKLLTILGAVLIIACNQGTESSQGSKAQGGMASIPGENGTIVAIASSSKDHTILTKAVQAAGLVDSLANPGPFTVFAPTDAAFGKLPQDTLNSLLKPENKGALEDILYFHTMTSMYKSFEDGQDLISLEGSGLHISKKGNDFFVNHAKILATIQATNGVIHVIDTVLLPEKK